MRSLAGWLGIVGCILCWSTVPVMLRALKEPVDAWTTNGIRYPLAACLYWPVLVHGWRSGRITWATVRRCIPPGIFATCGQILWGIAPYYLDASAIGFLIRLTMVFTVVGSMILFPDERRLLRRWAFYVGLGVTVIGFAIFSSGALASGQMSATGILIMAFCSLFFGLYAISVRYCLVGINPIDGFSVVSQMVSVAVLGLMVSFGEPHRAMQMTAFHWTLVVSSSILGVAIGHALLYTAIKSLGAAITSGIQTVMPFLTAVFASIFLGEVLSAQQKTGGVTIVIGVLFLVHLARTAKLTEASEAQVEK